MFLLRDNRAPVPGVGGKGYPGFDGESAGKTWSFRRPPCDAGRVAIELQRLGLSLHKLKEFAKAENAARQASARAKAYSNPYALLGRVAISRRQYDRAISHCEKAVALARGAHNYLSFVGIHFTNQYGVT